MPKLSPLAARRIKIAISALLFAGLLWFLDTERLLVALSKVDPAWLVLAFAMVIVNRILMPVKWNMLLRARGQSLSTFDAIRIYTMSSFLGLMLPPTIGADSIRSYYLNRSGITLSDAVASIAVERVLGLLVLLSFTIAGFALLVNLLRDGDFPVLAFAGALALVSAVTLAAVLLSFSPRFGNFVTALTARSRGARFRTLASGIGKFVQAYQDYRHRRRILAIFCLLTALELCLVIVRSYVIALALGVDVTLLAFFAFLPFTTLMSRMPVSFDGFGINEALFVYFLGLFGVVAEQGFLIGLVNHLVFLIGVLPGGVFYVLARPASRPGADVASK